MKLGKPVPPKRAKPVDHQPRCEKNHQPTTDKNPKDGGPVQAKTSRTPRQAFGGKGIGGAKKDTKDVGIRRRK